MAKAKADPEQAPAPAPPAAAAAAPVAAPRRFLVRGPKGTFEVAAATEDAARHWYKNETALPPELVAGLAVAALE